MNRQHNYPNRDVTLIGDDRLGVVIVYIVTLRFSQGYRTNGDAGVRTRDPLRAKQM